MRHSFLRADTKNRFPCSRPWPRPCAGTKGAFAVPPGLKRFQRVGKARLRRSFPTERVSPALSARPGKRAGKPCCARLPNPPHMSARQAARWKRAACPAQARDAFSKSKLWGRHREFGIQLGGDGGKRVPCGHLPPKVAKRPEGVNRNERWARPAPAAMIEVAGLRALQTSQKRFVNGLKPCCARLPNPSHMSQDSDFILEGLRPSNPQKTDSSPKRAAPEKQPPLPARPAFFL